MLIKCIILYNFLGYFIIVSRTLPDMLHLKVTDKWYYCRPWDEPYCRIEEISITLHLACSNDSILWRREISKYFLQYNVSRSEFDKKPHYKLSVNRFWKLAVLIGTESRMTTSYQAPKLAAIFHAMPNKASWKSYYQKL